MSSTSSSKLRLFLLTSIYGTFLGLFPLCFPIKVFFFTPYCAPKSFNVIYSKCPIYCYFFISNFSIELYCIIFRNKFWWWNFPRFSYLHIIWALSCILFYCFIVIFSLFNLYSLFNFLHIFPFSFIFLTHSVLKVPLIYVVFPLPFSFSLMVSFSWLFISMMVSVD